MVSLNNAEAGTPDWFMKRLVTRVVNSQERYNELERYVTGNHPFPKGDQRYVKALIHFQRMARTNYYGLVTMSPVERMRTHGVKFNGSDVADEEAAEMHLANDMDFQELMINLYAATFGDSYVLVSPPDDSEWATFTMEDPRMCATESDPVRPMRALAGLRMWNDIYMDQIVGVLYTNDGKIHYYAGPKSAEIDSDWNDQMLLSRLTGPISDGGFEKVAEAKSPIDEVPLVRFAWQPSLNNISLAEAEAFNLKDVQDRINQTVLDRMIITRSQAYKQRWVSGAKPAEGQRKGSRKAPFDPGSDVLWVVESSEAKFGEFSEADIRQLLEAVQQDVGDMAAISKTPPHYLLGKIVNASGDALKASEAGLVSKTRLRMRPMGWGYERITKLGFKFMGNAKASQSAKTIWGDPEERPTSELADAGLKYTQMGIPLALAMEKMQFTPEEIKFAVAEKKKEDARQMALAAVGMSTQPKGGQSGATKPGGGNSASTKPASKSN